MCRSAPASPRPRFASTRRRASSRPSAPGRATGATRARCCGGSPSSSSPSGRPYARGDRHRARKAPAGPRTNEAGLVEALGGLDRADRRPNRRDGAPQGGPDRMHRMRLPVARPLQDGEPGRPGGEVGTRPAILGRRLRPGSSTGRASICNRRFGFDSGAGLLNNNDITLARRRSDDPVRRGALEARPHARRRRLGLIRAVLDERALAERPDALAGEAAAVHEVRPGAVNEISAELIDECPSDRSSPSAAGG